MLKYALLVFGVIASPWLIPQASAACETTSERYEYILDGSWRAAYKSHMNCTHINLWDINYTRRYDGSMELVISQSSIQILPHSAFPHVNNISSLTMENVSMEAIMPGAFIGHPYMEKIDLAKNRILSIPDGVFNALQNLTYLNLTGNAIESVSDHAFVGTRIAHLNLSRNAIRNLSTPLRYLPNLETLDLSFNHLSTIEDCFQTSKLELLRVDHNRIKTLDMHRLPPVRIFGISSNGLSNLSTTRDDIFTELYLRDNKLSSIEPLAADLEVLDLGQNLLANLTEDLFLNASRLKALYLDGNGLSSLPNALLIGLDNLTILSLADNHLSSFSYGTFDDLRHLRLLDVSGNRLKTVPISFHSLGQLEELYLHDNELGDLDSLSVFDGMFHLQVVSLDGNGGSCEGLRKLTLQLRRKGVRILGGNHSGGNHVFGIACSGGQNENSYRNPDESLTPRTSLDKDFESSRLYKFFQEDFKNTKFARFFDDVSKTGDENSRKLFDDFDKKFENSSGAFLDRLLGSLRRIGDESFQAPLKSYADKVSSASADIVDLTTNIKLLANSIKNLKVLVADNNVDGNFSLKYLHESVQEKFVSDPSGPDDYEGFAIFILILLMLIVLMIAIIVYVVASRFRYGNIRNDVHLLPIIENNP